MKNILILVLIVFFLPNTSNAELSQNALDAIGKFLIMDFQSIQPKALVKPLSNGFFVEETGDSVTIAKGEILSLHGLDKIRDSMIPGKYRRLIIINEFDSIGCVLREAFINDQNQVYWLDDSQSLLKFKRRPELGNTGVASLMDYEDPKVLADIFRNAKRGILPDKWQPTEAELDTYVLSINAMNKILINRP